METKTFVGRMLEFFGRKPGQSAGEFSAELRALSDADKLWFVDQFNKSGLPTTQPAGVTVPNA